MKLFSELTWADNGKGLSLIVVVNSNFWFRPRFITHRYNGSIDTMDDKAEAEPKIAVKVGFTMFLIWWVTSILPTEQCLLILMIDFQDIKICYILKLGSLLHT